MNKSILVILLSLLLLTACGKRGPLENPPGGDPNYPRTYPQR